jgi:raffinose/stachyose/melibiose transport system permease protein
MSLATPRRTLARISTYAFLILLAATTLAPLVTLVFASLKKDMELIKAGGFALPQAPQWQNYILAWQRGHMSGYFISTSIVTVAVVVLGIAFAVSCAYALTTLRVPFAKFWTPLFMLGIIFPESSIVIPSYFNMRSIGLYNTYWALILPQVAMSIAFGAFYLQPAFKDIPQDLMDSACIDGCGDFATLLRVLLPQLAPAISVLSIFFFLGTWNDFLLASILVSSDELRTLPFALLNFQNRYTANAPLIAAGTMISAIPAIIVYLVFFKKVVQGTTAGAMKE